MNHVEFSAKIADKKKQLEDEVKSAALASTRVILKPRDDQMPTCFKPLRRKIGVLTLVMACVIVGVWLRSFTTTNDHITVWENHSLYSHTGSVCWNVHYRDDSPQDVRTVIQFYDPSNRPIIVSSQFHQKARWEFCGLVYSDQVMMVGRGVQQYWITYWYFITPLTLLSAWLLLSKPRVAK